MTAQAPIRIYELAGADPEVRFSPHCWKARMALAHKGLEAEGIPWRFTEKAEIAFSGQGLVPVMVDRGDVVFDSWRIAEYLEAHYPERPSLFGGEMGRAMSRFINGWADTTVMPAIARIIVLDIHDRVHEKDRDYFRASREKRFGMALEEVVADREKRLADLCQALTPLRHMLQHQPFICGDAPAYADYCAFGMFMWIRCISPVEALEPSDAVHAWRERLLDAFGGFARRARTTGPRGN
ncbi:glutathione S-transferase family protein [Aquabacter sp. CN5-332]|uniref:glutathione S-transferase family protein n=1 Tax=Aquabacter sp. CN5-332 TaxID=3156608 RepID=UPI0032B55E2E